MTFYHQARDWFHCCFRISCLLHDSKIPKMEFDKIRILDFYMVFPDVGIHIKLPKHLRHAKKSFQQAPVSYERISEPSRIFDSMADIQAQAVRSMIGAGLVLAEPFTASGIVQSSNKSTEVFNKLAQENAERKSAWYQAIIQHLVTIELLGPDGLKARTKLLDHHHDIN